MSLDVATIRKDFPVLSERINDKPLVYLDSANTSQKPRVVIDALAEFMATQNAPINRSAYHLAAQATERFESTRSKIATFINAPHAHEVIFTKNATESLNLAILSWGRANLASGDVVLLTHMEHHANIVPWHMLVAERGIVLRWVPLTNDFQLDLTDLDALLTGAKVFSFTSMSNVLGTINPVERLCAAAHRAGALAIVDACQSVPHQPTDVQAWGADLVAFSSHKMCGPSGVGILWGREELLNAMPPFLGGGNMIADVRVDGFTTAPLPNKFEAGTPAIRSGRPRRSRRLPHGSRHARGAAPRDRTVELRPRDAEGSLRRRHHDPRAVEPGGSWRDVLLCVPRHPSARPEPGARPAQRVRARGSPLRQALDAPDRGERDGARELLSVQHDRRGRRLG